MLMSLWSLRQSAMILDLLHSLSPLFTMNLTLAFPLRYLGMIFFAMSLSKNLLAPFARREECKGIWLLIQCCGLHTQSCPPPLLPSVCQFCSLWGGSHWISGLFLQISSFRLPNFLCFGCGYLLQLPYVMFQCKYQSALVRQCRIVSSISPPQTGRTVSRVVVIASWKSWDSSCNCLHGSINVLLDLIAFFVFERLLHLLLLWDWCCHFQNCSDLNLVA